MLQQVLVYDQSLALSVEMSFYTTKVDPDADGLCCRNHLLYSLSHCFELNGRRRHLFLGHFYSDILNG